MVARGGAVCNNKRMPTQASDEKTPAEATRVDLPLIWRAASLSTGDAGAGRAITAEVARAHPRPETSRESTLVASYLGALQRWRDAGSAAASPEPLVLSEQATTIAARLRSKMEPRAFDVFVLLDVLGVERAVLGNAIAGSSAVDTSVALTESAEAIDELRTIYEIDPEPMLSEARDVITSLSARRKKLAFLQFIAFVLMAAFLVYVKVDLKHAADFEAANRVPSMVEQFSNPLPAEASEPQ